MAASLTVKCCGTQFTSVVRNILLSSTATRISHISSRYCSSQGPSDEGSLPPAASQASPERDPYPLFIQSEVQSLLGRITGFDLPKVAGPQKIPLQRPNYQLLTNEELQERQIEAADRLKYRLQMPLFMNPRKPFIEPLVVDPDLAGHDTSKYVFCNISFGIKDRNRSVVLRETDGSLHHASWDIKERVNQIYNPRERRHVIKPAMFEEKHLERILRERRYIYILDRACCQFEPDDPDYIRTTRRVYNAVDSAKDYEVLRSTRHFGPMAFYLVWNKMSDSLILDTVNRDLESDAKDLVSLYCLIHPDSACSQLVSGLDRPQPLALIKAYIESEAKQKELLELATQGLMDAQRSEAKENRGQGL